jgi:hypothetical protein
MFRGGESCLIYIVRDQSLFHHLHDLLDRAAPRSARMRPAMYSVHRCLLAGALRAFLPRMRCTASLGQIDLESDNFSTIRNLALLKRVLRALTPELNEIRYASEPCGGSHSGTV